MVVFTKKQLARLHAQKAYFAKRENSTPDFSLKEYGENWENQTPINRYGIVKLGGTNKPEKFTNKEWNKLTYPQQLSYSFGSDKFHRKQGLEYEESGRMNDPYMGDQREIAKIIKEHQQRI